MTKDSAFDLYPLDVAAGQIALTPLPGRFGSYDADLARLLAWSPSGVVTMTTAEELAHRGAGDLGEDVQRAGVTWWHMPITDFGAPDAEQSARWPDLSIQLRSVLQEGGRIVIHCHGGCGRSGMVALRLMVELGEAGPEALNRLRAARPCAVETEPQLDWAFAGAR